MSITSGRSCKGCVGCGGCSSVCSPASEPIDVSSIPLMMMRPGDSGRIVIIKGKDDVLRFLRDLGFIEGLNIAVVSVNSGNMILDVKGTRIAVDGTLIKRIFIVPESVS